MKRDNRLRWALIFLFIIAAVWYLYPTLQYYNLTDEQKSDPLQSEMVAAIERKAIKRGLDLQGGVRLVMQIELASLIDNLAVNKDAKYQEIFNRAVQRSQDSDIDLIDAFEQEAAAENIRLERYFDRDRRRDADNQIRSAVDYLQDEADNGIRQNLGILRNRIDQFGVAEPNIRKEGDRRIIVELPGIDDVDRATDLIGQTAKLEFKLLREPSMVESVFDKLDALLKGDDPTGAGIIDTTGSDTTASDSVVVQQPTTATTVSASSLFQDSTQTSDDTTTAVVDVNFLGDKPFRSLLVSDQETDRIWVVESNFKILNAIFERDDVQNVIPVESQFLLSSKTSTLRDGRNYYELFLLKKNAELDGSVITEANVSLASGGFDPSNTGPRVTMQMDRQGSRDWSRITGANIQKQIAIVLDDRVVSAPVVQSQITGGNSEISGNFTMDEAKDLAIILRAGAFTAEMEIVDQNTVSASLGADSVRQGTMSAIIGLIVVAIFMIIYYKFAGTVADLALLLNLLFVMAILAGFHATLTLPGIAGLILTIGMAVDANVLIFERIREELATGKTVRAAIDSGYSRAFVTILDANVTTLITAIVLFQYGTGPIKGFALVLSIGIVTSMFTAIIVTRVVFDFVAGKTQMQKLSI